MLTKSDLAPAFVELVSLLRSNATAHEVAAFVRGHKYHVALSHTVESYAEDGTFAAQVFDILCND